jgi:ATP-dependent DNA ligase
LTQALAKIEYPVLCSTAFDVKPADVIRAAKELELEGIIANAKDRSTIRAGAAAPAEIQMKYKIKQVSGVAIGGYTAGNPFDGLIIGCYEDDELRYVSRVKAGFNSGLRRAVHS